MAESYGYGRLERRIAGLLSRTPLLKAWIKHGYSRASYHLAGGSEAEVISDALIHEIGIPGTDTFFGYYDKSPLSIDGWLLCHAARHASAGVPQADTGVDIQVFDFIGREFSQPTMSVPTRSYNWQQGARAHWLDGDHFIFNDFDSAGKRYISRVYSATERSATRHYSRPVQDSWKREYFLSINYQRLQALRPDYGYRNMPGLDDRALDRLDDDGIWRVEQDSGESRLLYSLKDICLTEVDVNIARARHKVNHVMIGPDGRSFIFLHRYFIGQRKFDRLMLGAADGSDLKVLCAHGMVSHCFWASDTMLLCYLRDAAGKDGYRIVHVPSGKMEPLFGGALDAMGDGHPHVRGDWFVTDTYPDKRRMQTLTLGNLRTGEIKQLARMQHSFRYGGESRCDLHPRIGPDGDYVFFDSVCNGRRRLYAMALNSSEGI